MPNSPTHRAHAFQFSQCMCPECGATCNLSTTQLSGRIALMVFCSTDLCGLQDNGRWAKARNEAESSRWNASSW